MLRITYSNLERIYHEVKTDLLRYLTLRCGHAEIAEDLLQTVFLKLIPVLQQERLDLAAVRPYLFRMARNEMMDMFRKRSVERKYAESVENLREDTRAGGESLDARIAEIVDAVLAGGDLDDRQKEVLEMRLIGQVAMQDVAAAMDISRSTAYRELEIGLQRLQTAFAAAGLTPEDISS